MQVNWAVQEAIKEAVQWGLAMRAHELDPKHPAPSKESAAHFVSVKDLEDIATTVLLPGEKPWTSVPKFKRYLDNAPSI